MSSPLINFAWGLFNLVAGVGLLSSWPIHVGINVSSLVFLAGVIVLGAYAAVHFGHVRRGGPH